jgi:hypothetical protein
VLAYTQADVECILIGFEVVGKSFDYVLKVKKNVFGQKQADRVWNKHLVNKLKSIGFKQSVMDYKCSSLLETELEVIIKDMQKADLNMTIEGDISDF